jgi:hypothetical protein
VVIFGLGLGAVAVLGIFRVCFGVGSSSGRVRIVVLGIFLDWVWGRWYWRRGVVGFGDIFGVWFGVTVVLWWCELWFWFYF